MVAWHSLNESTANKHLFHSFQFSKVSLEYVIMKTLYRWWCSGERLKSSHFLLCHYWEIWNQGTKILGFFLLFLSGEVFSYLATLLSFSADIQASPYWIQICKMQRKKNKTLFFCTIPKKKKKTFFNQGKIAFALRNSKSPITSHRWVPLHFPLYLSLQSFKALNRGGNGLKFCAILKAFLYQSPTLCIVLRS